ALAVFPLARGDGEGHRARASKSADRGADESAGDGAQPKERGRGQDLRAFGHPRQGAEGPAPLPELRRVRRRRAGGPGVRANADKASSALDALDSEKQVKSRALAQIDILNQQINALRKQL